jgi:hypothetical protein
VFELRQTRIRVNRRISVPDILREADTSEIVETDDCSVKLAEIEALRERMEQLASHYE